MGFDAGHGISRCVPIVLCCGRDSNKCKGNHVLASSRYPRERRGAAGDNPNIAAAIQDRRFTVQPFHEINRLLVIGSQADDRFCTICRRGFRSTSPVAELKNRPVADVYLRLRYGSGIARTQPLGKVVFTRWETRKYEYQIKKLKRVPGKVVKNNRPNESRAPLSKGIFKISKRNRSNRKLKRYPNTATRNCLVFRTAPARTARSWSAALIPNIVVQISHKMQTPARSKTSNLIFSIGKSCTFIKA